MKNQTKSKNNKSLELKKGSELHRVFVGVQKHPGLTISGVGKALRWKFGPGRSLLRLTEMGLLTRDKKTKTFVVR